jgi:hypothetical protein
MQANPGFAPAVFSWVVNSPAKIPNETWQLGDIEAVRNEHSKCCNLSLLNELDRN